MLKRTTILSISAALIGVVLVTSCGDESRGLEYMPDMYRGPAVETYQPMEDSTILSALKPVEGTVPRGFRAYADFAADQSGYDSAKATLKMPMDIPTDEMSLEEAAKLYDIFCSSCHGKKGDGQGALVKREKFLGVPSYADRDINLGSIFHVMTYGKGVMGSHASQLTPDERWLVAQYVVKLKKTLNGDTEEAAPVATADSVAIDTETTN